MDQLLLILTYIAVTASAVSGSLEARKYDMDIVGATTIAFVTAFGGGTIRDMLLGRTPVFWVVEPWLTVLTFVTAIAAFYRLKSIRNSFLIFADAIGLGLFSILGATYTIQLNLSPVVAVLMGIVTGIFGGVLRDLLCNQMPSVFRSSTELYATCSFVGTWVFILLMGFHVNSLIASTAGAIVIFALRLLAVKFKVTLPSP